MHQYHLSRGGKLLGVYPEDSMRQYFAEGRIGPDDLVWREGLESWLPARQVFGGETPHATEPAIPAPPPLPPQAPPAAYPPAAYSPAATPAGRTGMASSMPLPPRLHWAIVLVLTIVTLGIFYVIWMFVQAAWVRKIDPRSNAMTMLIIYVVAVVVGQFMAEGNPQDSGLGIAGGLLVLGGSVLSIFGFFSMRRSMLDYFNQLEPIGLRLSGVMTFFFNILYFQYHMSRIARWKQTGVLPPQ